MHGFTPTAVYLDGNDRPIGHEETQVLLGGNFFDAAVNSGVSRGSKWLQRAVGAKQDGRIGRVDTIPRAHAADPVATVKAICPPARMLLARTRGPNSTTATKLLPLVPYHFFVFGYGRAPNDASEPQRADVNGTGSPDHRPTATVHPVFARAPPARVKATVGPLSFGQNDKPTDRFDRPNCIPDSGLG